MGLNRDAQKSAHADNNASIRKTNFDQTAPRSDPEPQSQRGIHTQPDYGLAPPVAAGTHKVQAESQATLIAEWFDSRAVSLKNARGRNCTT